MGAGRGAVRTRNPLPGWKRRGLARQEAIDRLQEGVGIAVLPECVCRNGWRRRLIPIRGWLRLRGHRAKTIETRKKQNVPDLD
jgi:hypothetical protein